ncbi:MAG TPA: hypothetical protein VKA70_19515 [Blastocatellia bacterium]|nr:hypothetical protein [Blastocatellia bacterium]
MRYKNVYALFGDGLEKFRGRNLLYERRGEAWEGISWERFATMNVKRNVVARRYRDSFERLYG